MKPKVFFFFLCLMSLGVGHGLAASSPEEVKAYLITKLNGVGAQSEDLVKNSAAYAALVGSHGSVERAFSAAPKEMEALVAKMQENYKGIDSFGYETVEGIVAGVPSMAHYDITLDAGVPASEGPDDVAPVVLDLGNGQKIDKEGALFTYIIEPALWAGNPKWVVRVGDKAFPRPEILTAAAAETNKQITALRADAAAWNPSVADCFGAMIVMTPTLSDYFTDWKESRFEDDKSGRFQAVSRISDMKGIMSSCAVMYGAVEDSIATKDKALAKSAALGFKEIIAFLDSLQERESSGTIKPAEIDELAAQAKDKTDKLVPQIEQGAAILGLQPSA
jgi:hypothetical protein